jgi:hypothetical protein
MAVVDQPPVQPGGHQLVLAGMADENPCHFPSRGHTVRHGAKRAPATTRPT